jgi:CubicO group peptidase (beta-lactamase class C family)
VAISDSIVFGRGYGLADVEHGRRDAATAFRLASVTKQFTARRSSLVDDGRLRLDDEAWRSPPRRPAYAREVRVGHLLAHTSGIPDYEPILGGDDANR